MGSTVYAEKPQAGVYRLYNSTGVALVKGEFTVLGGKGLVAAEAIGIAGTGTLEDARGQVIQVGDTYESGHGTFALGNLPVYWDPSAKVFSNQATVGFYLVGHTIAAKSGTVTKFIGCDPILIPSDYSTLAAALAAEVATRELVNVLGGRVFRKTVVLTAAAAGTAVHIIAAADVATLEKIFITDFLLSVGGATAWSDSTGTIVTLQDTASSPVVAVTFAKAQLTGNAQLGKHSTGVTLGTTVRTGVGLTADKGLDIVADSDFDAGSDISITVSGFIAEA